MSTGACALEAEDYVGGSGEELSALLTGTPEGLCVESGLITDVLVQVKNGWTNSDAITLDINITGENGDSNIQHGHVAVPVSAGATFSAERDLALISLDWNDTTTTLHPLETYTVDIQVLAGGTELGVIQSQDFPDGKYGSCL